MQGALRAQMENLLDASYGHIGATVIGQSQSQKRAIFNIMKLNHNSWGGGGGGGWIN